MYHFIFTWENKIGSVPWEKRPFLRLHSATSSFKETSKSFNVSNTNNFSFYSVLQMYFKHCKRCNEIFVFQKKSWDLGCIRNTSISLAGVEFCEVWKESKKNWDNFSWLYENTLILQSGFLLVDGFIVPGIGENRLVSFLRGLGDRSTHLSRSFYSQTKTSWESSFWNRRTADLGGLNSRRQSLALPVHLWQPKVMPHLDLSMALKSMVSPYLFSQQLIFLGKQIKKNKWNLYILIFSLGHSWHGIKLISQEYISNCI